MMNTGISAGRSLVPFGIFVVSAVVLSCIGAMNIELLVAAGIAGMLAGGMLADDAEAYWKTLFGQMGSPTAMTATLLWLVVSIYGNVLKAGHIVEGLVWAVNAVDMGPSLFTAVVFLFSALFAVATGSGFGTISSMSITLFPAGVAVGADPSLLGGAILSGAALGDSIAPVSDTAVIAASTQTYGTGGRVASVGGTVKHRLPLVLCAMAATLAVYLLCGRAQDEGSVHTIHAAGSDWKGLALLIPTFVVVGLAFRRVNIFMSLAAGIVLSVAIGLSLGLFAFSDIVRVDSRGAGGAVVDGIGSMSGICILLVVAVALSGVAVGSGCMEALERKMCGRTVGRKRDAEWVILALSLTAGILIAAVNTIANICVAPIVNHIGNEHRIHPFRRVTILALSVCTFPFVVPYGGCVLLLCNGVDSAGCQAYVRPGELLCTTFYPWALLVCVVWYCARGKRKVCKDNALRGPGRVSAGTE